MTDRPIDPNAAVDYLLQHASKFAEAKATRIQLEEFRKSKKALLMNECEAQTVNAREQYAYSHPEYIELLGQIKDAVEIEERLRWMLEAARMRVDIWRSQEASNRSVERTMR